MLNAHTPVSTVCDTRVTTHLALRARLNTVNTHGFSVNGRHLFHAIRNRSYNSETVHISKFMNALDTF